MSASDKTDISSSLTEAVQDEVTALAGRGRRHNRLWRSLCRLLVHVSGPALRAGTRYIAYTSDIGEAFRPVVPPWMVTAAYGISWLYLGGDVSYEAYKAHRHGPTPLEAQYFSEPVRIGIFTPYGLRINAHASITKAVVAVERAYLPVHCFHVSPLFTLVPTALIRVGLFLLSPSIPAVRQATKAFAKTKNPRVRSWGPTLTGLAIVPVLPYLFDHPVEHVTDKKQQQSKPKDEL
ncbi:mitochondrial 18 KDa protein-domain-containing protein, partial [Mycena metata]